MVKSVKKISIVPIAFVVCVLVLMVQQALENKVGDIFGLLRYADKFFLACMLILVLYRAIDNKVMVPFTFQYAAIFIVFGVVSLLVNYPSRILYGAAQILLVLQGFIALFLLSNAKIKKRDVDFVIRVFILLGVITFMIAVVELVAPDAVRQVLHGGKVHETALSRGEYSAVQSIFGHPGMFSWYMAFCFCITLSLYIANTSSKNSTLYIFLAAIFFVGVLISLRRKSLIGCIVCGFLAFILRGGKSKSSLILIGVFVFVFVSYLLANGEKLMYLVESAKSGYDFSSSYYVGPRVELSKTAVEIANDHFPLGTGFGTFGSWYSRIEYSPVYREYYLDGYWGLSEDDPSFINDTFWPMIIAEVGWFGFVAYVLLLVSMFKKLLKIGFDKDEFSVYRMISVLIIVELILESIASPSLSRSPQIFFVMCLVGMIFSAWRLDKLGRAI